ncbi:MAG: hypothetical protein JSR97_00375 [Verrucomicrobia bacterium]|nr:hypothetical protein [Verrucomicrobiota bacterium]
MKAPVSKGKEKNENQADENKKKLLKDGETARNRARVLAADDYQLRRKKSSKRRVLIASSKGRRQRQSKGKERTANGKRQTANGKDL